MSIRPTTKHDIQRDEENITRPGFDVITNIIVSGTMLGISSSGIDTGTGQVVLTTKAHLPFGVFTNISPMSASLSYPYAAAIDRTVTFKSLQYSCFIATTNDASNYWKIYLLVGNTAAQIKLLDTSAMGINAWTNVSTSTFDIQSLSAADKMIFIQCDKFGSPGNLYLAGPMLLVEA